MIARLALLTSFVAAMNAPAQDRPPLMANTNSPPHVTVQWPTIAGPGARLEGDRDYRSIADKAPLGLNIECFAAIGGTRIDKGLGDPDGATVRLGLQKKDLLRPFFDDITPGGAVAITIANIRMNQPVEPRPRTTLMVQKYSMTDLADCGLDGSARNLIITADPGDPIREKVQADSVRLGGLDGGPDHGKAQARVEPDGTVTITVSFPYTLLRHLRDPNLRTKPGTFFEPQYFHIEMELMPAAARTRPAPASPPAAPTPPADPRAVYLPRSTGNGE